MTALRFWIGLAREQNVENQIMYQQKHFSISTKCRFATAAGEHKNLWIIIVSIWVKFDQNFLQTIFFVVQNSFYSAVKYFTIKS